MNSHRMHSISDQVKSAKETTWLHGEEPEDLAIFFNALKSSNIMLFD